MGTEVPDRCGRALQHALKGLLALHNVTIDKCKEEERDRLRQQIIAEEQHPKMANPFEPIKMDYEPISKKTDGKEHVSRSRRRKRERKNSEIQPSGNYLIETNPNVDKNAILIHKENKTYPSWHEPHRNDNFAWKLHLKTLLYEKICLAYATLAEHSYAHEQYGFSLKYIDMASKCQKLLSNMIIKSRVVDVGCLIGRIGDNYFQLSKQWHRLEQFKKQFETDHEVDSRLRLEIENDLTEEVDGKMEGAEFDLDLALPTSEIQAMLMACSHYRRAVSGTQSDKRSELQRRLASVTNELAVRYMNDGQQIYLKYIEEPDEKDPKAKLLLKQFNTMARRSQECLDEAAAIFKEVGDVPNLALLYCNKGRYMRFKAHCSQGEFNAEKRALYKQGEELYLSALKLLGPRESCGAVSVWDLVSWELSCHLYTRAALLQDTAPVCGVTEVAEAFKHALKYCLLSPGPRQYLYQFRAAMIYHRLGSLYHSQYRITQEEGPKRRTLVNATRTNYEQAANMFALLEDAGMYLTVQLEHVAVLETQAIVTPNLKLKSLQSAIQLLRQCHSIMKLMKERDPDEQREHTKCEDHDEKSIKNEHSLLALYENRLHFILRSIIQYCKTKSNKDYEKITEQYKKLYSVSLRIKKSDDVSTYAGSICDVLVGMDEVSKEFE
ncbi:hypothetical protein O0L34_g14608 [Tuta absoluta]|nr:hypothetical protein O0L34_g14608 [Tuta absoluta]